MRSLKHVLRRLGWAPLFTSIALVTLALGIGANTAVFSVINSVLIKPLPYPHADSLVGVWHTAPGVKGVGDQINCSPTMYFTYREQGSAFEQIGLWTGGGASITGLAEPEQVRALRVTYGLLDALSVQPAKGRWFSQADDTPGSPETVLLMYSYWQRRFGGKESVIGSTITIDSRPHIVIGVMPASFGFRNDPAVVLPMRFERNKLFLGNFSYQGIARLKPGVTLQQANADVARMLPIWVDAWPVFQGLSRDLFKSAHFGPKIQPLKQEVVGDIGPVLWVLMGTIGLVLLIACANVANLLLVRAEGRQQELAIRAALGAGWGTIAREMLLESVTLSVIGGALGLAMAYGALRVLVAKGPANLPRLSEIAIDPVVLAFTLGVSLLTGVLFGLIPVFKYAGPNLASALRGSGRSLSAGREHHRARNTLVVVQVALALVLLIGSGLMLRTFQALRHVDPGFTKPEELQLMRVFISEEQVKEPERVMRIYNDMMDKLAAIPGVTSVALASSVPLDGFNNNDILYAEDKTYTPGEIPPIRRFRSITPGFLKTMGTLLIAGREFDWTDLYQKHDVAMVSENLAREMWGSPGAALGKRVKALPNDPWREVVGVIQDVYSDGVNQKAPPTAYWPALMGQFEGDKVNVARGDVFIIRSSASGTSASRTATESFLTETRQAIWSVNGNLPVFLVQTQQDLYNQSLARTSFTLVMLAIAGGMALVLGVVGIYGVIAYAVSQRTREIGIRMALGAQPAGLQRMFVRSGMTLAGIGAAIGLAAALGLTQLMKSLLFGISALDPVTYVAVAGVLIAAAALASYFPSRRATSVDPTEALRAE